MYDKLLSVFSPLSFLFYQQIVQIVIRHYATIVLATQLVFARVVKDLMRPLIAVLVQKIFTIIPIAHVCKL
jgi:hypothetical protein